MLIEKIQELPAVIIFEDVEFELQLTVHGKGDVRLGYNIIECLGGPHFTKIAYFDTWDNPFMKDDDGSLTLIECDLLASDQDVIQAIETIKIFLKENKLDV